MHGRVNNRHQQTPTDTSVRCSVCAVRWESARTVCVQKSDTSGIRTHARRLVPKTSALDRSAIVSNKRDQHTHIQTQPRHAQNTQPAHSTRNARTNKATSRQRAAEAHSCSVGVTTSAARWVCCCCVVVLLCCVVLCIDLNKRISPQEEREPFVPLP